jgi:hypothetical protein
MLLRKTSIRALGEIGIGTIAIMPNDTKAYREDSFDNMKMFAAKHCFTFPSVIDATQEVARAYGAQCTPDFFGFKPARRVAVSRSPRCSALARPAQRNGLKTIGPSYGADTEGLARDLRRFFFLCARVIAPATFRRALSHYRFRRCRSEVYK